MAQFPFIPSDPKNVPLRPLDKGIILDVPPQGIPAGGFLQAQNLMVSKSGLTRRNCLAQYTTGTLGYPPIEDLQLFWTIAGLQKAVAYDQKFIYDVAPTGFTGKYWVYNTGTITVDAAVTVEGAGGMLWATAASEVQAGDIMVLDPAAVGDGPESIEILSITDDDTLVLATACVGTYAGDDYEIRRAFDADEPFMIDSTVVPGAANVMLFADGSRFLYSYDGATFTDYNAAEDAMIPRTVTYFQNRVWMGNIQEANDYKQRIRWSMVFPDTDDFSTQDGYLDLPYQKGELLKLEPMGPYLVAYFADAIFIGRRSNIYGLPLLFEAIETGSIGLVGTRAVVPFIGGHFFVGQDNIYWLDANGQVDPEGMGSRILKRSLKTCSNLWRIRGIHDPASDSILFGVPKNEDYFETIWQFNYRSKSWSEYPIEGHMLSTASFTGAIDYTTWVTEVPFATGTVAGTATGTTLTLTAGDFGDAGWVIAAGDFVHITAEGGTGDEEVTTHVVASLTNATHLEVTVAFAANFTGKSYQVVEEGSTYAALSAYDSFSAIQPSAPREQTLYLGVDASLYYFLEGGSTDYGGTGPTVLLETGDFDLDLPDVQKVWTRLSLKIEANTDSNLLFNLYVSTNRGRSWKSIGDINIPADEDEGFITFRTVGASARFKIVGASISEPYTLNEIILRARPMGLQVPGRSA